MLKGWVQAHNLQTQEVSYINLNMAECVTFDTTETGKKQLFRSNVQHTIVVTFSSGAMYEVEQLEVNTVLEMFGKRSPLHSIGGFTVEGGFTRGSSDLTAKDETSETS